jgi:uncharacterized protein YebE (UPF0316 family)
MNLVFLCIKIFLARILDVSIGTVRTVIMVKGKIYITTLLAFIEVFIWFMVAREALVTNINSFFVPISYSLGYATGTFIGTYISNNYIKSIVGIEIIVTKNQLELIKAIKKNGFAVSVMDLKGNKNGFLLCQISNKKEHKLIELVKKYDPNAFIIVNETKYVFNGFIK